jgi:hypothetical protein
MANIDARTPQLKVVKKWLDTLTSLDMNEVDPLISRNFTYHSFPKTIDLPEQTKEVYIQWFDVLLASITKSEVRIQR